MDTDLQVNVNAKGTVLLGDRVTADGFLYKAPFRVQTHTHQDHMEDFSTSKGTQTIYMSQPTLELISAQHKTPLAMRSNIKPVEYNMPIPIEKMTLRLLPSGHMLGSAQVSLEIPNGPTVGYSGDFAWPLEKVIAVDQLVVDSTYGSPLKKRLYSQKEAEERLSELISSKIRTGPILIKAHRGVLERALEILDGLVDCPVFVPDGHHQEILIHQKYGYAIGDVRVANNVEAAGIEDGDRYVELKPLGGSSFPDEPHNGTSIILSAYMSDPKDPQVQYSESSYRIAITSHADFEGTVSYVAATGASIVVCDNARGGHGVELAKELRAKLGVEALASNMEKSYGWALGGG